VRHALETVRARIWLPALVLLAFPGHAYADATFTDADFPEENWTATVIQDLGGGSSTSGSQEAIGGNPGSFRRVTWTLGAGSFMAAAHRQTGAVYTPSAQGPIASIDFAFDSINLTPAPEDDGEAGRVCGQIPPGLPVVDLLLRQNGTDYRLFAVVTISPTWQSFNSTGKTALDFGRLAGTGPAHPDFTAAGGPIELGFMPSLGDGGPSPTRIAGIDNWAVTIHTGTPPAPEPGPDLVPIGDAPRVTVNRRGTRATIQATVGVKNQGSLWAGLFRIVVYLVSPPGFPNYVLKRFNVGYLRPGRSKSFRLSVTISYSSSLPDRIVGVRVDAGGQAKWTRPTTLRSTGSHLDEFCPRFR